MIHEKIIEVTINVLNPINFCADKNNHLMAELKNKYAGHCFKGAFISKIKQILRTSACYINTTNTSGEAYIDVEFLAEVVTITNNDILIGVEFLGQQPIPVGIYKRDDVTAVVSLLASQDINNISIKQLIPVRVIAAKHSPMAPEITVVAELLSCDKKFILHKVRGTLDKSAIEIEPLLKEIEAEILIRNKIIQENLNSLTYFEMLMYSHRVTTSLPRQQINLWPNGPIWDGFSEIVPVERTKNIIEIAKQIVDGETVSLTGIWSRPLNIYRSSPLVSFDDNLDNKQVINTHPKIMMITMLINILNNLRLLRQFIETYNTKDLIEKHRNIWIIMRKNQIS